MHLKATSISGKPIVIPLIASFRPCIALNQHTGTVNLMAICALNQNPNQTISGQMKYFLKSISFCTQEGPIKVTSSIEYRSIQCPLGRMLINNSTQCPMSITASKEHSLQNRLLLMTHDTAPLDKSLAPWVSLRLNLPSGGQNHLLKTISSVEKEGTVWLYHSGSSPISSTPTFRSGLMGRCIPFSLTPQ